MATGAVGAGPRADAVATGAVGAGPGAAAMATGAVGAGPGAAAVATVGAGPGAAAEATGAVGAGPGAPLTLLECLDGGFDVPAVERATTSHVGAVEAAVIAAFRVAIGKPCHKDVPDGRVTAGDFCGLGAAMATEAVGAGPGAAAVATEAVGAGPGAAAVATAAVGAVPGAPLTFLERLGGGLDVDAVAGVTAPNVGAIEAAVIAALSFAIRLEPCHKDVPDDTVAAGVVGVAFARGAAGGFCDRITSTS